jgi:hypothetical protein
MATPPLKWPIQTFAARNSAALMPACEAKCPISRKSGITDRECDANCE